LLICNRSLEPHLIDTRLSLYIEMPAGSSQVLKNHDAYLLLRGNLIAAHQNRYLSPLLYTVSIDGVGVDVDFSLEPESRTSVHAWLELSVKNHIW
jgi:hypothetical protein